MKDMEHCLGSEMLQSLPEGFAFYQFGQVKLDRNHKSKKTLDFTDLCILCYPFHGEVSGIFYCFVEKGFEVDIYMEMGNIISTRTLGHMARKLKLEIVPLAPKTMSTEEYLKTLPEARENMEIMTYCHFYKNNVIPLYAGILISNPVGAGHA